MYNFSAISNKRSIWKTKSKIGRGKIKKFINQTSFSKDFLILSINLLLYSLLLFFSSSEYSSDWRACLLIISLKMKLIGWEGWAVCLWSYFFILLIYFYKIHFSFWLKYGKNSHQSPQSDFYGDLRTFSN